MSEAADVQNTLTLKKKTYDIKFDLEHTKYEARENIGSGAYGVVCSAVNRQTNKNVAIKKIPNIFDLPVIAKRTYREIKILKHFKHDNIISIQEILKPTVPLSMFSNVYIVLDLMESDLHRIIYSQQHLTDEHIRYFLYQILRGLKYIHSANVIHRDLKPSNLLVNENCELKIGDFGMARGISAQAEEGQNYQMTFYVATRWYRAPELLMVASQDYTAAVDLWSVGCILAEMIGKKQLFPGRDFMNQIERIVNIMGTPPKDFLKMIHSELFRNYVLSFGQKTAIPWRERYPSANKKALDLLGKLLQYNPKRRLSAEQALNHPYLNKYHDPDDEPICIPVFNFDFEKEDMKAEQIKSAIIKEIMEYHQPKKPLLNFSDFNLKPVPKHELTRTPPGGKQENSVAGEGGLEAFLQQLRSQPTTATKPQPGTCSEASAVIPQVNNKDSQPQIGEPTGKAELPTVVVDSLKTTTDVEMLSAKFGDMAIEGMGEDTSVSKASKNSNLSTQSDVEMLSAKISETPDEPKKDVLNQGENKFQTSTGQVSMDTKALIKAAILKAGLRKQQNLEHNSGGDGGKSRPVTAIQRQREREEKRRKKIEKAKERKKKDKPKDGKQDLMLTEEDRNLLERWKNMQVKAKPVAHPIRKYMPELMNRNDNSEVVLKPEAQNLSQCVHQQTTGNSTDQPMKIVVLNKPDQGQGQSISGTNPSHPISVSYPTHNMNQNVQAQVIMPDIPNDANLSLTDVQCANQTSTAAVSTATVYTNHSTNLSHLISVVTNPVLTETNVRSDLQPHVQPSTETALQQKNIVTTAPLLQPILGKPPSVVPPVGHDQMAERNPPSTYIPGEQNATSILPHFGVTNQYVPLHTNQTQSSNWVSLVHPSESDPVDSGRKHSLPTYSEALQAKVNAISQGHVTLASSDPVLATTVRQQNDVSQGLDQFTQLQTSPTNIKPASVESRGRAKSDSNQSPMIALIQKAPHPEEERAEEQEVPSPDSALQEMAPHWLMDLSKQIMKSHVEDLTLAQTPKGTGDGYGVGLNLDILLSEAINEEESTKTDSDSAPLSASLIADWLEVSGNMDPKDLEALQRELGDMGSPLVF